jgi:hypothetical protein
MIRNCTVEGGFFMMALRGENKTSGVSRARNRIGFVIEKINDIEIIHRDCTISMHHGFLEIRINHRLLL